MTSVPPGRVERTTSILEHIPDDLRPTEISFYDDEVRFVWYTPEETIDESSTEFAGETEVESEEDRIECPDCGDTFETNAGLASHRESKHGDDSFECEYCGRDDFSSERAVSIHQARSSCLEDDTSGDDSEDSGDDEVFEDVADELQERVEDRLDRDVDDIDLSIYGGSGVELTPGMIRDALEGSQSVYHVERDLVLERRETEDLLAKLGVLEQLKGGAEKISPGQAERIVEEAVG